MWSGITNVTDRRTDVKRSHDRYIAKACSGKNSDLCTGLNYSGLVRAYSGVVAGEGAAHPLNFSLRKNFPDFGNKSWRQNWDCKHPYLVCRKLELPAPPPTHSCASGCRPWSVPKNFRPWNFYWTVESAVCSLLSKFYWKNCLHLLVILVWCYARCYSARQNLFLMNCCVILHGMPWNRNSNENTNNLFPPPPQSPLFCQIATGFTEIF